ncbi:CDC48 family AAA ATPase [Halegenticoccus tardaugens]|uniref:CDC48 family AAA ATPase n=1 Tax=Halegenticoccus tardaugens TaxID=2071624 RepID=UPI00100B7FD3|nr:CDC48 family AAA ATPase [Halegenticoccus tardaugens]
MKLTVDPPEGGDAGSGVAMVSRETMRESDLRSGDYVVIRGPHGDRAVTQVLPSDGASGTIRIDEQLRRTTGVDAGDRVTVEKTEATSANRVTVALSETIDTGENVALYFRDKLIGRAVIEGQTIPVTLRSDGSSETIDGNVPVKIVETDPAETVVIRDWTKITVSTETANDVSIGDGPAGRSPSGVTYGHVGGLEAELEHIRELTDLPMRHPELFQILGITPPTGVLLHGPSGTGKTLLTTAIANETEAHVERVSGPEIVSKRYGEAEERLREAFEAATRNAPALVFIDDLDSIAGTQETNGKAERGIVAQLLSLLDGLDDGDTVTVVAATASVDAIDPALRRPGRFDREIEIGVPDKGEREEILRIHTRGTPLGESVDLETYAERTHGFVGADLENLVKESAMRALRRIRPADRSQSEEIDPTLLDSLRVTEADFNEALTGIEPSALREVFTEVPDVSWDDVGGLSETKQRLQETVQWPLAYPDAYDRVNLRPATGVLLYGPPGTGKTLLAKAVANESTSNFISIKGPELLNKYVGESEKGVREIFAKARENAPTVVFFDEIDAIAGERGQRLSDSGVGERVVSQLLTELDGLEDLEGVVVIATTNRPDLLDDALLRPGRFDHHIDVTVPDEPARREIFAVHTRDKPLAESVDLDSLAERSDGCVGADIEAICREAATIAVREFVDDGSETADAIYVTSNHFDAAFEAIERGRDGWKTGVFDFEFDIDESTVE